MEGYFFVHPLYIVSRNIKTFHESNLKYSRAVMRIKEFILCGLMSQSIPWLPNTPLPGVCQAFSTVLVPRVGHLLSAG